MYYVLYPDRRQILKATANLTEALEFARNTNLNVVVTETFIIVSYEPTKKPSVEETHHA